MGVVWGEGVPNQRGPATGAGISHWVDRLIRVVWERLFLNRGDV